MKKLSISMVILSLISVADSIGVAQIAQQPVGPSAQWCKDRTMHPQPGRYRVITVQTGDSKDPQKCIEVLDTQQSPVCRVRFECERAT
jgi:hypothetical protein